MLFTPLFSVSVIMTNIEKSYLIPHTLYEHVIVWRNVGKTRLTLYECCKVRRKTRLIQHSFHIWKNVSKRRLVNYERNLVRRNVEQTKLESFHLTKVRRNVEKSYRTRWLQMHYSMEKRCQRTKVQRQVKETLWLITITVDKTIANSARKCNVRKNAERTKLFGGTVNYGLRQLISHLRTDKHWEDNTNTVWTYWLTEKC